MHFYLYFISAGTSPTCAGQEVLLAEDSQLLSSLLIEQSSYGAILLLTSLFALFYVIHGSCSARRVTCGMPNAHMLAAGAVIMWTKACCMLSP